MSKEPSVKFPLMAFVVFFIFTWGDPDLLDALIHYFYNGVNSYDR